VAKKFKFFALFNDDSALFINFTTLYLPQAEANPSLGKIPELFELVCSWLSFTFKSNGTGFYVAGFSVFTGKVLTYRTAKSILLTFSPLY